MKYFRLYLITILFLCYSNTTYAVDNNTKNNLYSNTALFNNSSSEQASIRAKKVKKENTNAPLFDYINPQSYSSELKESEATITDNLFNNSAHYPHHTIRIPIININLKAKQGITNGNEINITSSGKSNSSISASYLYNLSSIIKIGPEIMHTTYNNHSNIEVNDSFSLMLRGEVTLYKNSLLEVYALGGAGISFNRLNLIYTRLSISKDNSNDAYTEYVVKPIINGSTVPDRTPYFYCATYARFDNLDYNVFPDPEDEFKGTSAFAGDGFGTCVYQNRDKSKNYTVSYENFVIPKTASSIPWFVGVGIDYNLTNLVAKIMKLTPIDAEISRTSNVGISFNTRYFDNGISRIQHEESGMVDQYTIKYKSYLSFSVALYLKI